MAHQCVFPSVPLPWRPRDDYILQTSPFVFLRAPLSGASGCLFYWPSSLVFRMAQAFRPATSSPSLSDDPMEKMSEWLQSNSRLIVMIVGGVAVAALAIVGYRSFTADQATKASTALYAAQAPMAEQKLDEAAKALERVSKSYGSTASGQQAALLLAQVQFEQKKYADGIASLEQALGSASSDFKASMESMIAVGYELQGKLADAAEHYGKAAAVAKFENDKSAYRASQARSLMGVGKNAEAAKLWEELAKSDGQASQEANVRLGELAGLAKP